MRGKPMQTADKVDEHRIIPAHAGQTRPRPRTPVSPTDHPRACGANGSMTCAFRSCSGSSPRMRGKPAEVEETATGVRIIPAHAGQTALRRHPCTREPDHPRACGANTGKDAEKHFKDGSSPRMRGKHASYGFIQAFSRIIPAHAGQTECGTRARGRRTDHPRACGANLSGDGSDTLGDGSSPRMRGKHVQACMLSCSARIIPAHAGQTVCLMRVRVQVTDHPRACGANCYYAIL